MFRCWQNVYVYMLLKTSMVVSRWAANVAPLLARGMRHVVKVSGQLMSGLHISMIFRTGGGSEALGLRLFCLCYCH